MKLIKIQKPEDIMDEYMQPHYATEHNPGSAKETALTIGGALGGLYVGGTGVKGLIKNAAHAVNPNANQKPFLNNKASVGLLGAGIATAIGSNVLANRLIKDKKERIAAERRASEPDYDSRLSPYAQYSKSMNFANFRSLTNIKVDSGLVNELDLNEREKYTGVADVPTLAAQTALVGLPAAYTYRQNRKLQRADIGEAILKSQNKVIEDMALQYGDSPKAVRAAWKAKAPKMYDAFEQYNELVNSPEYARQKALTLRKRNLGIAASIAGSAAVGYLARRAYKKRAEEKLNNYTKYSSERTSFVYFSNALDRTESYVLPANQPDYLFDDKIKNTRLGETIAGLGGAALVAGSIMEPMREVELFNENYIQKNIPVAVDRTVSKVKQLPGKPSVKQGLYRLRNLSPKTYRRMGQLGVGGLVAGGVIAANAYNSQNAAYQRQLQTQAQIELQNRKKKSK